MEGSCLQFQNPIRDVISRIRFAPQSNNLLISSWDCRLKAPTDSALLDCCFQNGSIAFSIMLWDTCMKKAPGCVKILGTEVESMSLSVFNLLVSVGASVNTYDLRMSAAGGTSDGVSARENASKAFFFISGRGHFRSFKQISGIGNGRTNCSCHDRGFVRCVRQHIS
ncbi:hypothetical protein PVL29_011948 [Vitis rotundifolia]|uniref:Uncharacterized protein n=1 Tax=Vitis rotundifolia TaxID=103349 RepID=A0AA38ZPS2_VITRO|nr:hypothetical protein PVL29_011948 [Vitis rotundifolia]